MAMECRTSYGLFAVRTGIEAWGTKLCFFEDMHYISRTRNMGMIEMYVFLLDCIGVFWKWGCLGIFCV